MLDWQGRNKDRTHAGKLWQKTPSTSAVVAQSSFENYNRRLILTGAGSLPQINQLKQSNLPEAPREMQSTDTDWEEWFLPPKLTQKYRIWNSSLLLKLRTSNIQRTIKQLRCYSKGRWMQFPEFCEMFIQYCHQWSLKRVPEYLNYLEPYWRYF